MKDSTSALLMLLLSACCMRLPDGPRKSASLPPAQSAAQSVEIHYTVWHDPKRDRDVPVKIYAPAGVKGAPVVIVSHGIGEDRDSYEYLGRSLAAAGFVAVHITHAGTDRAVLEQGYRHIYSATKDPANWINRPLDVSFVVDRLSSFAGADPSRVIVAGHSAGAFTAFAAAGMTLGRGENFRDDRVRGIVAMSMPRMDAVVAPGGYANVNVPVLNMTGTCDSSIIYRTLPKDRRVPFEQARSNTFLITMKDVNHNTFSNVVDEHHALIAQLTIAFARGVFGDVDSRRWFDEGGRTDVLTLERK